MKKKRTLSLALALLLALSLAAPVSASGDEWYQQYDDMSGVYYNSEYGLGFSIDLTHGMIILDDANYMWHYSFPVKRASESGGIYVYTADEDGTEMRYDPSDETISLFGDTYTPITRHGKQYELPSDFDEDWYTAEPLFTDNGMEMIVYGTGAGGITIDGYDMVFDAGEYEAAADGGVYYADNDDHEMYYFPEYGMIILMDCGWPTILHEYSESESDMDWSMYEPMEQFDTGAHIMENVYGSSISTYVMAPFWKPGEDFMGSYISIQVLCQITNISMSNLTFYASDYFTLNNNGFIETGSSEYDGSTVAPGTIIQTFICFNYRTNNVNVNYDLMTMTADGIDIPLSPGPQTGAAYDALPGVYCYDNQGDYFSYVGEWLYIMDQGDGQYFVVQTTTYKNIADLNRLWSQHNVTLNADNSFSCFSTKYYWDPSTHTIRREGNYAEMPDYTYMKQNLG